MIELVRKLSVILSRTDRARAMVLLGMMALGAVLETVGIGFLFPYISLLSDPGIIETHDSLRALGELLHWRSPEPFLMAGAVALLTFTVLKNGYIGFLLHALHRFVAERQSHLASRLFASYLDAPYTFHLRRNSAEALRNFATEVNSLFTGVIGPLFSLLAEIFVVLMVGLLLLFVEPLATSIALVVLVILMMVFHRVQQPSVRRSSQMRALHSAERLKWVGQGLGAIKEIIVAGKQEYFSRAFTKSNYEYAKASGVFATAHALPRLFIETTALGVMMIVVIVLLLTSRPLPEIVPSLGLFAVAALRLMPSMSRMIAAASSIRFYAPSLDVVYTDLALLRQGAEQSSEVRIADDAPALRDFGCLEIRAVNYCYPGSRRIALNSVSLAILRGEAVALAGASGSGKSTLADIILGLLQPDSGDAFVDGVSIQVVKRSWQRSAGYVPQTPYLTDDSVRANVAFGLDSAATNDNRVWKCLELAKIDELIRSLPEGLDATIGEKGVRLSGGERQRLAIARALYADPGLLVFDEATSALDAQTEEGVLQTLLEMKGNRTLVIIAHRLSSLRACDKIAFLREGRMVAYGRFDELLTNNPEFREMVGKQPESERSSNGR